MGKGTSNYCCMRDIKYVNQNKHECNCITPPLNVIVTRNLNKNIKTNSLALYVVFASKPVVWLH